MFADAFKNAHQNDNFSCGVWVCFYLALILQKKSTLEIEGLVCCKDFKIENFRNEMLLRMLEDSKNSIQTKKIKLE